MPEEQGIPFRILVADDSRSMRGMMSDLLSQWGYDVVLTENGSNALDMLQKDLSIAIAFLDWIMPGLEGHEVCRIIRGRQPGRILYLVLVTSVSEHANIAIGLDAGADDYVVKPFNEQELRARLGVGERHVLLQQKLHSTIDELRGALDHVKQLQGLLPICMHCKRIRDDRSTWHAIEAYLEEHSGALFSHSICDECMEKYYPDLKKEKE
ncbi:MAG: response regulator transcription factor [Thermodesulfobacteriota bacterium]|nr:response regulator transcription factor [Thermodesulfobacteriota bacterium]